MRTATVRSSGGAYGGELLKEMAGRGLKASRVTYHELLNAMVTNRDRKNAWRLVDEMREVGDFLTLAPFAFKVEEAHNTHKSRSVHVEKEGKSNAAELKAEAAIDDALGFGTYCILHEFFRPYNAALDELLAEYAYPPMRWSSGRKGDLACPDEYKYWKDVRGGAGDQVLETHQSEFFGDIDMRELDKEKKTITGRTFRKGP